MKFIDLWEDEYMQIRSPFLARLNDLPARKLMQISDKYKELSEKRDEILQNYDFINDLIDGNEPPKNSYTSEDMGALLKFFNNAKMMDNYERLEIYKLGNHDCLIWMDMIGLL